MKSLLTDSVENEKVNQMTFNEWFVKEYKENDLPVKEKMRLAWEAGAECARPEVEFVSVRRDILAQVIKHLDSCHCFSAADGLRILLTREPQK